MSDVPKLSGYFFGDARAPEIEGPKRGSLLVWNNPCFYRGQNFNASVERDRVIRVLCLFPSGYHAI